MRLSRRLALGASMLAWPSWPRRARRVGAASQRSRSDPSGSTKPRIMAEIYAQVLEANGLHGQPRRHRPRRPRACCCPPSRAARSTSSPSTSVSGLGAGYGGTPTGDPAANKTALQEILDGKGGGITVLDYTPGAGPERVRGPQGDGGRARLTKMSDVAAVQDQLKLGLAKDCPTNPLCGAALKDAYGIDTSGATLLDACSTPMADALKAGTIDLGELCSTQPDIIVNGFVLLEDDKQTQPADNIAPLVRNDFLAKTDKAAFSKLLNDLLGQDRHRRPSPTCTSRSASTRRTSRTSSRRSSRRRAWSSRTPPARPDRAPAPPGPVRFPGRYPARASRAARARPPSAPAPSSPPGAPRAPARPRSRDPRPHSRRAWWSRSSEWARNTAYRASGSAAATRASASGWCLDRDHQSCEERPDLVHQRVDTLGVAGPAHDRRG